MTGSRDTLSLNEGQARFILIDPTLRSAGWNLDDRTQVGFEVPVDGYDAEPWNGVTDRGYISVGEGGQQIHVEEYKRRVENRILEIVESHPALAAIREGREVTDEQLVDLERTLHRELGEGDLHLSPKLIRLAYGLKTDNFLGFLRHVLTLDAIPDYTQVVRRVFEQRIATHRYNADQIRFLRAVQELFLTQRTLVEADLYEPPLTVFGRNAVDRFFSPAEVREILDLTGRLAA